MASVKVGAAFDSPSHPSNSFAGNSSIAPDPMSDSVNAATNNSNPSTLDAKKPVIAPIHFGLEPSPTAESVLKERVVEERKKRLNRMLRFSNPPGTSLPIHEPPKAFKITETAVLGARRAAVRQGFATGFDTTSEEEQQKRQARIARFGPPESHPFYNAIQQPELQASRAVKFAQQPLHQPNGSSSNPLLETRRDAAPGENPRVNALHLYGVDQLSTGNIIHHFSQYGPSWCEWLNDSSCNVIFEDEFTLTRVLDGMSLPISPEDTTVQSMDEGDNSIKSDTKSNLDGNPEDMLTSNQDEYRQILKWRPLRPFLRRGQPHPLWGRLATTADTRPEKPNPKSKWSRTMNVKGSYRYANPHKKYASRRRTSGITKNNKNNLTKLSTNVNKMDITEDPDDS